MSELLHIPSKIPTTHCLNSYVIGKEQREKLADRFLALELEEKCSEALPHIDEVEEFLVTYGGSYDTARYGHYCRITLKGGFVIYSRCYEVEDRTTGNVYSQAKAYAYADAINQVCTTLKYLDYLSVKRPGAIEGA